MNNLLYLSLDAAVARIQDGKTVPDGAVISAPAGAVEGRWSDVQIVEQHVGSKDWQREWSDGIYRYELLVARQGVAAIRDVDGDQCGFAVVGTNRRFEP